MPAPVSVVIPVLNAAADLPDTLAPLVQGVAAGLVRELVVSDGGSSDESVAIAEAAGARVVMGAPGRGGQLARGAGASAGEWLLFLHADTHLGEGWVQSVEAHLARPDRAAHFRLAFRATGTAPRLVAGWANLRSRAFSLPYGDQGLLIARPLYDAIGGYPDIPLMEDVAIARALKGRYFELNATAYTSAERYQRDGWVRRGARNLWTLAQYRMGRSPHALAARYRAGSS